MAKYSKLVDGKTINLRGQKKKAAHKFGCCDCGLVHVIAIEANDLTGLKMTTWRDKRATAAMRRPLPKYLRTYLGRLNVSTTRSGKQPL